MKRLATVGGVIAVLSCPLSAGVIDPSLEVVLEKADPNESISTLVYLREQVDAALITRELDAHRARLAERHEMVVRALQETALDTQGEVIAQLAALRAAGRIDDFQTFWVANAIRVDATPAEIVALAARDDVGVVYPNFEIESVRPVAMGDDGGGGPAAGGSPEPGIEAVRAPEVWELGFTGEGVLVSTLDTGVDGSHPALASRWRGLDPLYQGNPGWAFFDPVTN